MTILFENKFITAFLEQPIEKIKTFDEITPQDFKYLGEAFFWIKEYVQKNDKIPDIDVLRVRFPDFSPTKTDETFDFLVSNFVEASLYDRLYSDIQKTTRLLQNQRNPEEIIDFLLGRILEYRKKNIEKNSLEIFNFASEFDEGIQEYFSRRDAFEQNSIVGLKSGLGKEFDDFLGGGFVGKMLYGAVGRTGVGKSFLSQLHGVSVWRQNKIPMYVALEGIPAFEYFRFLTLELGVSNINLFQGNIEKKDFLELTKKVLDKHPYYLVTFGSRNKFTPEILKKYIERYKPDFVIVDYLTMMDVENSGNKNKWEIFTEISKQMKILAIEANIPILALLQSDMIGDGYSELGANNIAASKGMSRDFDIIYGLSKVKKETDLLRVNAIKTRFSPYSDFKALYRTDWDKGSVEFLELITDDLELAF